jgi:hypothetical protein
MAMRDDFPESGEEYMGGLSDGWRYETSFAGSNLQHTFEMIQTFLEEEGYDDIPLPADAKELLLFKIPTRNRQILLFENNGYVHNPIKILFPKSSRLKTQLTLQIFNEFAENHLIKFHNVLERLNHKE